MYELKNKYNQKQQLITNGTIRRINFKKQTKKISTNACQTIASVLESVLAYQGPKFNTLHQKTICVTKIYKDKLLY